MIRGRTPQKPYTHAMENDDIQPNGNIPHGLPMASQDNIQHGPPQYSQPGTPLLHQGADFLGSPTNTNSPSNPPKKKRV